MKCKWLYYSNSGIKEAEINEWDPVHWEEEEAVLSANLSFASDRFLLLWEELLHSIPEQDSRQLWTDKFNLHLQYCMLGISAYL